MAGMIDLPVVWAFIIAFAVFVYVVMDGFDLGLGLLFPLFPKKADRDVMMNTVAPVWDGNETWLVLGSVGLLAAFPVAFAIILVQLVMAMLARSAPQLNLFAVGFPAALLAGIVLLAMAAPVIGETPASLATSVRRILPDFVRFRPIPRSYHNGLDK